MHIDTQHDTVDHGRRRFTGVSAFPLTPLRDERLDVDAYANLVRRLAKAPVTSITALGSTGSYAYLSREERAEAVRVAVDNAGGVPVFAGIGSLRTAHVHAFAEDVQAAGVQAVLLAPLAYQSLTDDDVFGLFDDVCRGLSVPLIVYDNPSTTHVTFSDDLYARIATLPQVASIKIPGVPTDPVAAAERVAAIRARIPTTVTIGVSGDPVGADGLIAGCDAWYSVIAGLIPEPTATIAHHVTHGEFDAARAESTRLRTLWNLFAEFGGSIRVVAAIAEHYGLAHRSCLPLPIRGLDDAARARVVAVIEELGIAPLD